MHFNSLNFHKFTVSDPDGSGFFADPDPGLKVRRQIRPLKKLWDLNDGLIRFRRSLTKKDSVRSARYEITV